MNYKNWIQIKKQNLKNVLISLSIIGILIYVIFSALSGIINSIYYNPTTTIQSEESKYKKSDFCYGMKAYVSLNMPGYSATSFTNEEEKGFGKYELTYSLKNRFYDEEESHILKISRGRLTYGLDGIFGEKNRFKIWEGFEQVKKENVYKYNLEKSGSGIQQRNERTVQYLKELNPLSYISMTIVFDRDLTMKEFYDMSKDHDNLDFVWVGVRTFKADSVKNENQSMSLVGFNPSLDESSSNYRPDSKKYPLFYLQDFLNNSDKIYSNEIYDNYGIHFKSRLEYLKNQKDYVNIFDYNPNKKEFYEEAIKYIDKNGIKTYGVRVFGKSKDFLESIDNIPYDSLYINEVLPVKSNIYYD